MREPSAAGMVPKSLLVKSSSRAIFVRLPIAEGIVEPSLFSPSSRVCRLDKLPMAVAMLPVNRLYDASARTTVRA